jgi:hypothetical protein
MRETEIMVLFCGGTSSAESPILRIPGGSWHRASYAARRQKGSCEERPRLFRGVLVVPTDVLPLKHAKAFYCGHRGSPASKEAGVQPFPIVVDIV